MNVKDEPHRDGRELDRRSLLLGAGIGLAASAGSAAANTLKPVALRRDMNPSGRFAGKVILITGATYGIGQTTAEAFAREGAKIRIIANISLDGVIQSPGGSNEDGYYAHGGWAMPYFDTAMAESIATAQGKSFDLLLGRHTYDIFASHWTKIDKDPLADGMNTATKYMVTHRPGSVEDRGAKIMKDVQGVTLKDAPTSSNQPTIRLFCR